MRNEPATGLPFNAPREKHIHIILSHNDETRDWSVEIDGYLHAHISTEVIEALVEWKLMESYTLLERQQCGDQGESVN